MISSFPMQSSVVGNRSSEKLKIKLFVTSVSNWALATLIT